MTPPLAAIFALDVRTVLVLLFTGNAAMAGLIFVFEGFTAESGHRHPLRCYALARLLQSLAWLLMLQRGVLPGAFTVLAANNLLLAGFFMESLVALELARIHHPGARRMHFALSFAAFLAMNLATAFLRAPGYRTAATSLGVAVCMAIPSVLFVVDPRESAFRRVLGAGNLTFIGVLAARGVLAGFDPSFNLYSTGLVQSLTFFLLILMMVLGGAVVLLIAKEDADRELRELATQDSLTGLSNRRSFSTQAARVLAYHQRYGLEASLLFIDIDHFKAVNDRHGHAAGDRVILHLAAVLRRTIREFDLHCRYGGEEFVLLLPNSSLAEGLHVAERIREEVGHAGSATVPYTVSVGLAASRAQARDPLEDLLARSDAALYRAKQGGRDRVEVDGAA
ncbi:GGDEF domain-containing protein [Mesoterricola silvestris]|uniref:diguanylate cyclase n=1 Tax=Mesoterricola silvestris TaxID=2927979 RepID=A0AA48K804_9BACT|nr:GGDEF domain-containing protein [Mesoterricola silvestris]BDU71721.1 GGDEF domain-containing protein [Mesoterricola silvestris]